MIPLPTTPDPWLLYEKESERFYKALSAELRSQLMPDLSISKYGLEYNDPIGISEWLKETVRSLPINVIIADAHVGAP